MEKDLKVGQILEVKSETYGKYNMTCIAFIDLRFGQGTPRYEEMKLKKEEDLDSAINEMIFYNSKWMDKFHPKSFFGSCSLKFEKPEDADKYLRWYVYVPLEKDNKNWHNDIDKNCNYFKSMIENKAKIKALPIAITDKKLIQWFEGTKDFIIEKIETPKIVVKPKIKRP